MAYLAYERTIGNKIVATIWMEELITAQGKRPPHVKLIPITQAEAELGIEKLKAKYPYDAYQYTTATAVEKGKDTKATDKLRKTGKGADADTTGGV